MENILEATRQFPDARIINLVGETLPRVSRSEASRLEQFRQAGVLDDYYQYANSFEHMASRRWMVELVSQIAKRNPHLNMLEIGKNTLPLQRTLTITILLKVSPYLRPTWNKR